MNEKIPILSEVTMESVSEPVQWQKGKHDTGFNRASVLWAVIPAMVVPVFGALLYYVILSEHIVARFIYAGTKVFTLVWPLVCLRWLPLGIRISRVNWRDNIHIRSAPLGVLIGAAIVVLMFSLMQTPLGTIVQDGSDRIRLKTQQLGILQNYWIFAFFISLAHSFLEEYYWRWFVYGRLRTLLKGFWAHALAGIAFSGHHIVVTTQFFPLFWGILLGGLVGFGGVIWSLMYERQRTLFGAWVSHIIVDFGLLILGHKLIFGTYFG